MAILTGPELVLRLTSTVEDLGRLYPWLDQAAVEGAVPPDLLPGMHVALEEAVTNAALHGYPAGVVGQITVRLRVEPSATSLVVEDEGVAFDPTAAPVSRRRAESLSDETPGGWGLGLIQRFCPAISYERRGEINHLTMRFPHLA